MGEYDINNVSYNELLDRAKLKNNKHISIISTFIDEADTDDLNRFILSKKNIS